LPASEKTSPFFPPFSGIYIPWNFKAGSAFYIVPAQFGRKDNLGNLISGRDLRIKSNKKAVKNLRDCE
jgi:hypothetical protein